jgi:hypothetical protein
MEFHLGLNHLLFNAGEDRSPPFDAPADPCNSTQEERRHAKRQD